MSSSRANSRFIDLIVLSLSFLFLVLITDIGNPTHFIVDFFLYVSVMFISLRLSKRIFCEYFRSSSRIAGVLLGNITGLMAGAILVMLIEQFFTGFAVSTLIIILSSIFAFFVLGTLSPMVKSSHRDIIHH